jgi:hypothetical protein
MSLSITQFAASASLAQSPMVFTVFENTNVVYSSSFQYFADLYYWNGAPNQSGSVGDYTLTKYPNTSLVGMFDFSRIINSTLTDLSFANNSNVTYYKADFYWQYRNASNVIVSSSKVPSGTYKALDGYALFQEPINQQIVSKSAFWPIMSDGPVTQSFLDNTLGWMSAYCGDIGNPIITKLVYSGSLGNANYAISGNASSSNQINYFPIGTACDDFPLNPMQDYFNVQAFAGSTPLGSSIRFEKDCIQKYPNIRIKWKNRYGQFDYFNFYLVNRQSFSSTKRTYQPQLGSWQGTSLSYENYDSSNLNYLTDSKQTLSVNSTYLTEDYNDILKQLLVSDEIYWIYDEGAIGEGFNNGFDNGFAAGVVTTEIVRPITITTNNIVFKTGVNDKLIQYQFDFDWGQSYKLII